MKHLLAVVAIWLAVIIGLRDYTSQMVPPEDETASVIATQGEAVSTLKVGILTNSAASMDDIHFRDMIIKSLPENCSVHTADSNGDLETQMAMFRKMVSDGYALILLDVFDASAVSAYTEIAMHQNVRLILTGERPSQEQMDAWEGLYYLGSSASDAYSALAGAVSGVWLRARGLLDRNSDGTLKYSVLSNSAYSGSQYQRSFEDGLIGAGITSELVTDSVTEVFSYDITKALDDIAEGDTELLVCSSSSDAYQAWEYFHDAENFETVPQIEIALATIDDGAQSLVSDGSVLLAAGYDGEAMGDLGAKLCVAVLSGGELNEDTLGVKPNGRYIEYANSTLISNRVAMYSQEVAALEAANAREEL